METKAAVDRQDTRLAQASQALYLQEVRQSCGDEQTDLDRGQLVRLAYRFLWNWHDAEDAVQDALALAEQKRSQLKDHGKWAFWVRRIVIQQCHLQRRRSTRWSTVWVRLKHQLGARQQPSGGDLGAAELSPIVKELIASLPERQQTALVLRHLEHMDYSAIAAVMQVAESTVRVHVRSGRETLRKAILKRYPEWAEPIDD
jgi:RNA polymerase sigma-70 factor (ECF subfamily)